VNDWSTRKSATRRNEVDITAPSRPPQPHRESPGFLRTFWGIIRRNWGWLAVAVVFVVGVIGVGAEAGYVAGRKQSAANEAASVAQAAKEQFDLGVEDLLAQRYTLARQRFEYVLSVVPDYPGAAELLGRSLEALNVPTPTASPVVPEDTPTPRPTLDRSSLETLFAQSQNAFIAGDWDGTIDGLLALRHIDPTYRLDEVNAMMAGALRNRGLNEIFNGDLEQGIYDLALAERFGPLDSQAASWRNTAEFYKFADSYYGLDWAQAARYFGQLCSGGTWDSCYRYAESARAYGDLLFATADPCAASDEYSAALKAYNLSNLEPTAESASRACQTATALPPTPTATSTASSTPTATFAVGPTFTPSITPGGATATPTASPSPSLSPSPSPSATPSGDTPTPTITPSAVPSPAPSATVTTTTSS
jgi:tetratricopeptide (TPR) repeat protein